MNHRLEMCWHKIFNNGDREAKHLSHSETKNASSSLISWGNAIQKGFNMENIAMNVRGNTNIVVPITGMVEQLKQMSIEKKSLLRR